MNTQTLIIFILVAICLFLLMVIFFIRKHNAELIEITEQTFENEQRLANKLEIAHQALKDASEDIQRNNQSLVFNGRVRLINAALNASKPEHLEF
jgi:regulatory protein YycI of two-component signal transduction system YycFG